MIALEMLFASVANGATSSVYNSSKALLQEAFGLNFCAEQNLV